MYWESSNWLVAEQLLEILSGNVAVFFENVSWMGATGWTGWLVIAVSWNVSSAAEEVLSENVAWLGSTV